MSMNIDIVLAKAKLLLYYANNCESSMAIVFKRSNEQSTVGIIGIDGKVILESDVLEDSIKCYEVRNGLDIISLYTVSDKRYRLYILRKTEKSFKSSCIYRASNYMVEYITKKFIVLRGIHEDDYGADETYLFVINFKGRRIGKGKYLNIINHKNTGDLLCTHYLIPGKVPGGLEERRRITIIKHNEEVEERIKWGAKHREIYGVTYNELYSRGISEIQIKNIKGKRMVISDMGTLWRAGV